MKHSQQHLGLQEHSVGEIYPWTIRGKGNTLQGFHCITGEEGPRFRYYDSTAYRQFKEAYQLAELWVEKQIIGLDVIDAARLKDAIAEESPIRLACRGCDRDDYDGVVAFPADWSDIHAVVSQLAGSTWWTHLGFCPDCQGEFGKP